MEALNKKVFFKTSVFTLGCLLLMQAGCGSSLPGLQSGTALNIVAPQEAPVDQAISLSIGGGSVLSATWTFISDNTKAAVTPQCQYQGNGAIATCTFQALGPQDSGKIDIQASYVTASGTGTVNSSLDLILPASGLTQDLITVALQQNSATVATISNNGTSSSPPKVMMNQPATVDLSNSVTAAAVSFNVDFGDDSSPVVLSPGNFVTNHTYTSPGQYSMVIVSTGDGVTSALSVLIQVECDSSIPAVQVTSISATAMSKNLYTFAATVSGGSGTYTTIWAPDGTGVFREPGSSGLTGNYYADYTGTQTIQVHVLDLLCQTIAPYSQALALAIPVSDGVPGNAQGPQMGGLDFVQGSLSSSSVTDPRANGFMALIQAASDPAPKRITGQYQPASDGSGLFNETATTLINDNSDGITIAAAFSPAGVMSIQNVTVHISGNTDIGVLLKDTFTTNSCTSQGTVVPIMGVNPCYTPGGTADPNMIVGYSVDYTYSCPSLSDGTGNTIALAKGAGYYVYMLAVDTCGGSGGSGGAPPPPF